MTVLSKSKVLAYLQCPRRLWLEVHQPGLRTDSSATTASFATGHQVGAVSRTVYDPDSQGVFLDIKTLGLKGLIAATQTALTERKIIFEAGFQANGSLSLADILIPVEDAVGPAWRMVEVKSSTSVKEYHVKDLAVQTAIAKKQLNLPASPQLLLNIFEVNMFEKIPLDQLVVDTILNFDDHPYDNQMFLF